MHHCTDSNLRRFLSTIVNQLKKTDYLPWPKLSLILLCFAFAFHLMCHVTFFFDKVVKLLVEGLLSTGPTPFSINTVLPAVPCSGCPSNRPAVDDLT